MSKRTSDYFQISRPLLLLIIFLLALSVKFLIYAFLTEPFIFYKYPYFAQMIAQGRDPGERILDLSPLYLYLNVIFFKLYGENWEVLAIFQIFLGSLSCLLIFLIGEKIFGKIAGLIAALILIFYANLTLIELTLEPEALVLFLNSLIVFFLLEIKEETKSGRAIWKWMVAGCLIGLAIITKPNALLILLMVIIFNCLLSPSLAFRLKSISLMLLGVAIFLMPITLRNYYKFNDFILVTADSGKVFFHGNGPGATGMERADLPQHGFVEEGQEEPDYAHALFRRVARNLSGQDLKPSECSRFWRDQAWEHIKKNPLDALILEFKKAVFFFGNYEVHDIDSAYNYYRQIKNWPFIPYGIISALSILGMWLARKNFKDVFLLYSMVAVYFLTVLIFFAASRYRLPAVPFLSLFAGYAVTSFISWGKEKKIRELIIFIGVAIILFSGTIFSFRSEVLALDRWQMATRVHYVLGGNQYFKKGEYEKAIAEYEKAITLQPDFAPAYNRLGMAYAILRDFEKAEKNFLKVIELAPEVDQGYVNLGLLYELKGERERAISLLEKALSINPENKKVKEHLKKLK
ncbi:MAG: tetratricopeptide repeat protein [Thermodesulfobacteriota bacterium]